MRVPVWPSSLIPADYPFEGLCIRHHQAPRRAPISVFSPHLRSMSSFSSVASLYGVDRVPRRTVGSSEYP